MHAEEDFEPLLERWLPQYGLTLPLAARTSLASFLTQVEAGNQRMRLVGSSNHETLVRRHLAESLYLTTLLPLPAQPLLDIGSGAGFPGLALALAHPQLKTTLVESTMKKAVFLQETVHQLGLASQVEVVNQHLPSPRGARGAAALGPALTLAAPAASAALITCRALDRMEQTPRWIFRLLAPGGTIAFWISLDLAATWRHRHPKIDWSPPALLPFADQRAIVLARS